MKARRHIARIGDRRKRLLEQQAALAAFTRSDVFNQEDIEQAVRLVTETTARLLGIERVSLWRYSDTRSLLRCIDLYEKSGDRHSAGYELNVQRYPSYFAALEANEAVVTDDPHNDSATREFSDQYLTPLGISAMLDIPVRLHGRLEGVLCHEQVGSAVPWTAEDRLFAIAIANLIALALEQSERKRTERALRDSEQRLATMLACAPDAIVLLDVETLRFVEANERAAQMFGLDRQALLQVGPVELSPKWQPDGRLSSKVAHEKVQEALAGGTPVFEWQHSNASGALIPCEVRLVQLPHGERRLVRGSINDISQRKRLEEERERLNRRCRLLLESAGPGIYGTDTQGRCTFMNRAAEAIIGYSAEEVLGRNMHALIHHSRNDGSPYPGAECPVFRVFESGQPCRVEGEVLWRRDGSSFPSEYAAYPIVNGGVIEGAVVSFSDISERLRAQAELRQVKEAAEAASRAKSEFLATMSHELRTPLNSVLGYAQLLRRQHGLSAGDIKALGIIEQSGEHLLGLIDDILDMAKIETGTVDIVAEHFDLHRMLDGVATVTRTRTEAKGLTFTSAERSDVPRVVRADERRLRQVLMNLLDNAVKYTQQGGIALQIALQGARVRFVVEDTGIGIEPRHLAEIFNVFHQVRDGAGVVEGTGLGLAISRQLTRLMGGDLHVSSTPGEGTRFWFDLDLPSASPALVLPASRTVIGVQGRKRRLLVVDDAEDGRGLLRDVLAPLGFQVYEAIDGEAAVREAPLLKPDAVLMDMRMPRLSGLQAARQLRGMRELRGCVIIAISASAFEQDRQDWIEAGAHDFIAKPFRQEKLIELLCAHLELQPVYVRVGADPAEQSITPPVIPPAERLQGLLALAQRGDVQNLLLRIEELQLLDRTYAAFAAQARTLAESYRMQELRRWLERCRAIPNECSAA